MCGAAALVECEIEVLSGSFAPWMLEKMKNNPPYIKMPANVPKGGVYTIRIFYVFLYYLYLLCRRGRAVSLVYCTIIYFLYHCTV